MKEYGGYFPLELCRGKEYHSKFDSNMIRVNSGRTAIEYCLLVEKIRKIYVPYYICNTVIESINKQDVEICWYYLDENFSPINIVLGEDEYLLWVNYFGIFPANKVLEIVQKYQRVIIDNSQAFFTEPIVSTYNVYSCRKFFGVSDGGYCIKQEIEKKILPKSYSWDKANFLLKSLEMGTNEAYEQHLINEKSIGQHLLDMSILTRRILENINYEEIKEIRARNFYYLQEELFGLNDLIIPENVYPMQYPLLIDACGLKEHLVEHKIYVPTLWKEVGETFSENIWEGYLSKKLILLPIDQRYTEKDMDYVAQVVRKYVRR